MRTPRPCSVGPHRFRVLIAGAGVAGLEAALALAELVGDRVTTTLLTPDPEFVYRPMLVTEPFMEHRAQRYALPEIARDIGAELILGSFRSLDAPHRIVHTDAGEHIGYDALLLALGARPRPWCRYAMTLDDRRLYEQMQGILHGIADGRVRRLAFLVPAHSAWPLPAYELALMTARRAEEMSHDISLTVITPEPGPLAAFGAAASLAVSELLRENGILMIDSARSTTPGAGEVALHPGRRSLHVDRIVALPELFGPPSPGVPKRGAGGFIPIDAYCAVPGLERVYAAGDATDCPVKHGGLAAEQADTAAEAIAALVGAHIVPRKLRPIIHAILVGADRSLCLSAQLVGGHGLRSEVGGVPTWSPAAKIAARHLGPYLEAVGSVGLRSL